MKLWNAAYRRLLRVTTSGRYIPEIDGLRFVAIAGVVLFHIHLAMLRSSGGTVPGDPADQWAAFFLERGCFGVQLFFIISGFILALPFIQQFTQGGERVRLPAYYLRRLTRLEPPYLVCLILFFIAAVVLNEDIGHGSYISQFLLRCVYGYGVVHNTHPLLNGVTWSLEIEVQFYLLVPLLVQIFRLGPRQRRWLLLALILGFSFSPFSGTRLHYTVLNFIQYFLAGFLSADVYLHHVRDRQAGNSRYDLLGIAVIAAGFLLAPAAGTQHVLLPLLGAGFILATFQGRLLNRILTNRALCIVGGACYTIYLYHYPIIKVITDQLYRLQPGGVSLARFLGHAAIILPVVAAVSLVMYAAIERPCMDRNWPRTLWARVAGIMGRPAWGRR